jgi:hypothetical protein
MLSRAARLTTTTAARLGGYARGHRTALAVAGAAAALAGTTAGTAAALTTSSPAPAPAAAPAPATSASSHHTATRAAPVSLSTTDRAAGAVVRHDTAPAKPFLMYDSTTPAAIPAHHPVATYADGGFAVPASQVQHRQVTWIDTNGTDPHAAALDVEPGDATPAVAAAWTKAKLSADPAAIAHIYTMRSEWPAVQAAVHTLPGHMQTHVRWWIADPTGIPHIVPGSQATQWYWGTNYDISTVTPSFN